jgi:REP element-mobilizing transposase RayT
MARPLRIERAGGWYHVTARGNERRAIYRDDRDRRHFCELLGEMVQRFSVRLHAYVLMENHYHLILELTESNLSRAAQWLNVSYSVWFNRRHERSGHLFQGRFKSITVDSVPWGLELSRYVHLNPVRIESLNLGKREQQSLRVGAGGAPDPKLVKERLSRLRHYRWSSYQAYVGLAAPPAWLECETVLGLGGRAPAQPQRAYREYVEDALREGLARSPWEALQEQVVLGGANFLAGLRQHIQGDRREQGAVQRLQIARPELAQMVANLERLRGEKWAQFRDRYGDTGRDLILYVGRRCCGLKLKELGKIAGLRDYSTTALAIKRFQMRLERQGSKEKEELRKLCEMSNVEM